MDEQKKKGFKKRKGKEGGGAKKKFPRQEHHSSYFKSKQKRLGKKPSWGRGNRLAFGVKGKKKQKRKPEGQIKGGKSDIDDAIDRKAKTNAKKKNNRRLGPILGRSRGENNTK